jgi:enoyl-CoA hydratase
MGIGAGDGGQVIWPFLIGVSKAKYFLMTGDRVKGREAYDLGLVSFYVEEDAQLMPKALQIAERLASGAPGAISASKIAVNAYLRSVSSLVMPLCLKDEMLTMQQPRTTVKPSAHSRKNARRGSPGSSGRLVHARSPRCRPP